MSVCITAVSSYNLCLSLLLCLVVLLSAPQAPLVTGRQASDANNLLSRAGSRAWPGPAVVTWPGCSGQREGYVTPVWAEQSVCGPGSRGLAAVTAVTLTGQHQLPQLPGPGSLAPSALRPDSAGRCCVCAGPGCCELRAGLRILTSTLGRSLGQAVVTSSHGVRTEKRISEQVFIH